MGMASSVIAPPFQRRTRSACPESWSRGTAMFTSSSRVRSSCLRSLSAVDGAPQTARGRSPRARGAGRPGPARRAGARAPPGAAAFDDVAGAGAVVAGGGFVLALVVDGELAAAGPAGSQALQQGAPLTDRAGAGLMCRRPDILPDLCLVGLVGVPVDEPAVVVFDEHLPLLFPQHPAPDPPRPALADQPLLPAPADGAR